MRQNLPGNGARHEALHDGALTSIVKGCFFRVYNGLGYGFLENVYRNALVTELRAAGLDALPETPIDVVYRGVCVGHYRLDVLVERRLAVEVKATELLSPTAKRQLLNYLRARRIDVGLLLHFGPEPTFSRLVSTRLIRAEAQ